MGGVWENALFGPRPVNVFYIPPSSATFLFFWVKDRDEKMLYLGPDQQIFSITVGRNDVVT